MFAGSVQFQVLAISPVRGPQGEPKLTLVGETATLEQAAQLVEHHKIRACHVIRCCAVISSSLVLAMPEGGENGKVLLNG